MGELQGGQAGEPSFLRLSGLDAAARADLLDRYRREVYEPAFPDAELREDPAAWLRLLAEEPGPPQPRLDVILAVGEEGAILGGVTIEHYRRADCGLLTYIAVVGERRGQGLGRRLIAEARARLDQWAGKDALIFAETEIYDEAASAHEREEIVARQQRLARLGAYALDLDYVMPPLRPGLPPRRLHLMVLDDPRPGRPLAVSPACVLALVEELAEALGADLGANAETAAMRARLSADASLRLAPLPASRFDRRFREAPSFPGLGAVSLTYAFELNFEPAQGSGARQRSAFRVQRIEGEVERQEAVYQALLKPFRSFLDDVTTGPTGRNGRPLVFAASADAADAAAREVTLHRPARWHYEYEGETTELALPAGGDEIPFRLRDGFCVFESGRTFYLLTLTLPPEGGALDEYALIQLEQLALEPADHAGDGDYLRFGWRFGGCGQGSLLALAEARLAALESATGTVNGFASIIDPFGIRGPGERRPPLAARDLRNLCLAIESEELLTAATAAAGIGTSPLPAAAAPAPAAGLPPHRDPENDLPPHLLALAGLVQGVPDFPFQDESEIYDSSQPACTRSESSLYVHPRFTIEIGTSWRSFQEGRRCIGTCPYLLLMWMAALHDEMVVAEMEAALDDMLFEAADASGSYRAVPLDDLARALARAERNDGAAALQRNIGRRLEIFRWLSISRTGNLFRYPKEKAALAAIQKAMGTSERFDRAHSLVDRVEGLVEDVSSLKSGYAEQRTNRILLLIALLSIFSMSADVSSTLGIHYAIVAGALLALVFGSLWLWRRGGLRFRKAGRGSFPSRTP